MENADTTGKLRGLKFNRERLILAIGPSAPLFFALYFAPYSTLVRHDIR
jgi:hypothetical protein